MSVINQMLRDLDKRRAANGMLSEAVRPLPAPAQGRPVAWTLPFGGILLLAIVAGTIYLAPPRSVAQHAAAAPASSPVVPIHGAAAPNSPAEVPPAPVPGQTAPYPAAASTADTPVAETKPATILAAAAPDALPRNATTAPPGEVVHEGVSSRPGKALAAPPGAQRSEDLATEARIDKQMRAGSARERADAEYQRGVSFLNEGRTSEATAALAAALREDAGFGAARQALASLLIEQRRLDEAQTVLHEGLAQQPNQPVLAMMLARVQVEGGDAQVAADTLQSVLPTAAGDAQYRALYAAVLQRAGRQAAAVEEYAAAVKLDPNHGVWWMGLGISLDAEGRAAEARQAFQTAKASGGLAPEVAAYVEQRLSQLR